MKNTTARRRGKELVREHSYRNCGTSYVCWSTLRQLLRREGFAYADVEDASGALKPLCRKRQDVARKDPEQKRAAVVDLVRKNPSASLLDAQVRLESLGFGILQDAEFRALKMRAAGIDRVPEGGAPDFPDAVTRARRLVAEYGHGRGKKRRTYVTPRTLREVLVEEGYSHAGSRQASDYITKECAPVATKPSRAQAALRREKALEILREDPTVSYARLRLRLERDGVGAPDRRVWKSVLAEIGLDVERGGRDRAHRTGSPAPATEPKARGGAEERALALLRAHDRDGHSCLTQKTLYLLLAEEGVPYKERRAACDAVAYLCAPTVRRKPTAAEYAAREQAALAMLNSDPDTSYARLRVELERRGLGAVGRRTYESFCKRVARTGPRPANGVPVAAVGTSDDLVDLRFGPRSCSRDGQWDAFLTEDGSTFWLRCGEDGPVRVLVANNFLVVAPAWPHGVDVTGDAPVVRVPPNTEFAVGPRDGDASDLRWEVV